MHHSLFLKCTKNCVCILQNLTYKAEEDFTPQTTRNKGETRQNATPKETTCSCFPYRRANLGQVISSRLQSYFCRLTELGALLHNVRWRHNFTYFYK